MIINMFNTFLSVYQSDKFLNGKPILRFDGLPWRYSDLTVYSYINASTLLSSESCKKGYPASTWITPTLCCHWSLWWEALKIRLLTLGRLKIKFHKSSNMDIWTLSDDNYVFISFGA